MKLSQYTQLVAATVLMAASASSHAGLIYTGVVTDTGSGIGDVNTVLTLKNNNGRPRDPGTGITAGSVIRTASGDATTGNVQPGQVHHSTWSFGQLNITNASQLSFIFNPVEPGNAGANSVRLESLVLTIYSDAGTVLYSTGLGAPIFFATSETGTGKSGYSFGLDGASIAAAQSSIGVSNRIGLGASLSSATGGPDTFFVRVLDEDDDDEDDDDDDPRELPEPGSMALLGLGMAGLTALRRRKRQA